MGHVNRHRTHGDPPKNSSRDRHTEKGYMESRKRYKRRRKMAKMRDRRRERHIQEQFGYNTDRICTSKVYYCSKQRVGEAMLRVEAIYGFKTYGYHCPLCGGWHITTKDYGTNEVFPVDEVKIATV